MKKWLCRSIWSLAAVAIALQASAAEPTPGKQVAASTTVKVADDAGQEREVTLRYWLFVPAGYAADEAKKWPLLLFLHGGGERGDDLELIKKHGPPKFLEGKSDFPCVTIAPQCPTGERWKAAELARLVESVAGTLRIDRQRIYVTGLSLGGAGTWALLAEHPGLFAAAVPICGRGDVSKVEKIAQTPVWATVGGKDSPATVQANEEMAAALKKAGGKVEFTLYPDLPHDCWTATYDEPKVWEWLFRQKLAKQQ